MCHAIPKNNGISLMRWDTWNSDFLLIRDRRKSGRQREVAALLVAAGARVESEWLESEQVRADPAMLAVLQAGTLQDHGIGRMTLASSGTMKAYLSG